MENMSIDRDEDPLAEMEELLEEDAELALSLLKALPPALRNTAEARFLLAQAYASLEQWSPMVEVLRTLLHDDDSDPDVHHLLGVAHGELGQESKRRQHMLRTLELDALAETTLDVGEEESDGIAHLAQQVLGELPAPYQQRLGNVLVVLEDRPARTLVEEGFDPRAYGLFEGLDHAGQLSHDQTTQVTRIVLYAKNLMADFPDPEDLAREVRTTVLHEVGHYFGLDEDDMVRLGLD